jgi:hypothetical protein
MTKPAVVLIGADKGGVGKTTVARTLLDYFAHHQVRVRAFDTEVPRGTLKRFHPNVTDVVDINYVPDQMRIFDTVNSTDATVSLIDVRAGLLSPTLRALRNIGFIEAAKKGEITFVVFHILGPSIASLDEIAVTAAYLGDAKYFMVKNSINNAHFFEWDEATHMAYFKTVPRAVEITIPNLVEMATEQVELASTRSRAAILPHTLSCSEAMSVIGLATSGPNTTASASPMSWTQKSWTQNKKSSARPCEHRAIRCPSRATSRRDCTLLDGSWYVRSESRAARHRGNGPALTRSVL